MLTAVGIEHEVLRDEFDWCLRVSRAVAPEALAHLEKYRLENQPHAALPPPDQIDSGAWGVLGYLLIIWMVPSLQGGSTFGWDWLEIGSLVAGLVTSGEWWRTITALTLHADLAHLVGNSLFGAVFGLFIGRYLGSGLGWLLILLGGATGNALNAVMRPDDFSSIGASTATFAALALGSGFVWRKGYFRGRGWRRAFAPIFAGLAMLSFTGMGGERTDVLAHVTGFFAGLGLGLLAASWDLDRLGPRGQRLCGACAVGIVALAWLAAGS